MTPIFSKETAFYSGQIKKYTAMFGSLFSGLYIQRESNSGQKNLIQVPIKYGPGFIKIMSNGVDGHGVRAGLVFPALAFEVISLSTDSTRQVAPFTPIRSNQVVHQDHTKVKASDFSPLAVNIDYSLTARAKTSDDIFQIVEQIMIAFSNPAVVVQMVDDLQTNIKRDITVSLNGAPVITDNYQNTQDESRVIEAEFSFTVKGYVYKRAISYPLVFESVLEGVVDGERVTLASDSVDEASIVKLQDNRSASSSRDYFSDAVKKVTNER